MFYAPSIQQILIFLQPTYKNVKTKFLCEKSPKLVIDYFFSDRDHAVDQQRLRFNLNEPNDFERMLQPEEDMEEEDDDEEKENSGTEI